MAVLLAMTAEAEQPKPEPKKEGIVLQHDVTRGTAEFIKRYRKQLHRFGCVEFELPRGAEMPMWMRVVLDTIRLRKRQWRVVVLEGKRGATLYRVIWTHWTKNARHRGIPLKVGQRSS